MVNLSINGKTLNVQEGTTVLEAAREAGVHIPTLCHHPDVTPYGACRLCLVEISHNGNGRSSVTTSCNSVVENGMVIQTDTPTVVQTRKVMADLILSRCPEVPAIQRVAASVGVEAPSFATDHPEEDCIFTSAENRHHQIGDHSLPAHSRRKVKFRTGHTGRVFRAHLRRPARPSRFRGCPVIRSSA